MISESKLSFTAVKATNNAVILSERSESKDLGISFSTYVNSVRRSFDFVLRTPLRMTTLLLVVTALNDNLQ